MPLSRTTSKPNNSVFGSEFLQVEDLTTSTTTSTTYQDKLTLNTGSIPAGLYRLGWYCAYGRSSTYGDMGVRMRNVTNSVDIEEIQIEIKDTSSNQRDPWFGFDYLNLSSGTYDFRLQYREITGGQTAKIHDTRIEFWRIS